MAQAWYVCVHCVVCACVGLKLAWSDVCAECRCVRSTQKTNLFSAQAEISVSQSTCQLVRNGPGMVCVCVHYVGVCMCRAKVGMA